MQKGTIIRLSYDMWLENFDGLFDTTDRDRATESGIYNPEHNYTPIVTVVGAARLVPGLEKALETKGKVGEWVEVKLKPDEAFGPRDPKKIEAVPMQRFKQNKVEPHVGERIQYKGRAATVSRVAGGRVWVDSNSPLAGREVTYKFRIEEIVEDPAAKISALLELDYRPGVPFEVTVEGKTVEVLVPDQVKYDQQWPVAKFRIAHDVGAYTDIDKVRFVEEFKTTHETHTHADGTVHAGPSHDDAEPPASEAKAEAEAETATKSA